MVQTIQARDISLYELEENFGLELVTNNDFFTEWVENLPLLTDVEKSSLDRSQNMLVPMLYQ
ncbi:MULTISPECIES: hypothetical protein [Nostocaceae]|uniref:hypothetical protein n=1 Tax=Nostocaceae TaxID=1162 RepID=UPI001F54C7E9|nr:MULTISPECIES: hypothetical protein [Nostocaceae]